jgi:queuine tRNA-ribosyltransferase/7-cyano-7-deazaguanine tRNA-ribosyltransferase
MISFSITKKSKKSNARLGIIKTPHGEIQTPAFIGVATQGTLKTLDSKEAPKTGLQALICNTFHLHLKPGEDIVAKNKGLHKFMDWNGPIMTDSGGFQVFSLGFGRDYGTGKILKTKNDKKITIGHQPKNIKITSDGVWFNSPIDGSKLFIGPRESIKIQEKIGADIIFAFDECTSPLADYEYNKKALQKTHSWAKICLEAKKSQQALYGIVQGGKFKDLRIESAKFIGSLPFDGFGIGGEFGDSKQTMEKMLSWVIKELPEEKPRHLLGIGQLEDMPKIIKQGVDTFDCTIPTHYARHGYAFIDKPTTNNKRLTTKYEKIDMNKMKYLKDSSPLDRNCDCYVCKTYTRSFLCHLIRSREITGLKLLSFHNLYYFNKFVEGIREEIKDNKI